LAKAYIMFPTAIKIIVNPYSEGVKKDPCLVNK